MFKFIEGTDNKAIITSDGRVFKRYPVNRKRPEKGFTEFKEVKPRLSCDYSVVDILHRKGCYVHRLVAETFLPRPLGATDVDHIDGNKSNNRVENLRWATHKENCNNPNTKWRGHRSWSNIQGFNPKTNFRTPVFKDCREASNWITPEGKKIRSVSLVNCLNRKTTYRNYFWTAKLVTGEEYRKLLE